MIDSRSDSRNRYKYELTEDDHIQILQFIKKIECKVAISCYPNSLYGDQLKYWRKIEYQSQTRGGPRTEILYMNYRQPTKLHDYRFLGDDYKERESIKKKLKSLKRKISKLPPQQFNAIKEYINQKS